MDANAETTPAPVDAPKEGTFKRVFLAPGRMWVAMHNVLSGERRKLRKGHWMYTMGSWMLACISWLAILGMAAALTITLTR
jgi:hypothetical protein